MSSLRGDEWLEVSPGVEARAPEEPSRAAGQGVSVNTECPQSAVGPAPAMASHQAGPGEGA